MGNADLFLKRYYNHIHINGFGVPGQEALIRSKILVVGLGDLASPVLCYLASTGFATIGIISNEKIRKEDLPSQPIFYNNQEGKLKGQSAAMQLREINPEINVILHEQILASNNVLFVLGSYDIVVDTGNDQSQSLLISDACIILGKPMVFGALLPPTGHYAVFNYKGSATFRCMLANQDVASLMKLEQNYGFASLSGIVGGFLVNEVIKIVGEIGEVASNRLFILNSYTNKLDFIKIDLIPSNQTISTLRGNYKEDEIIIPDPSPLRSISAKMLALKMKYKESIQLIDISEHQNKELEDSWNFLHIPESEFLNRTDDIHQDIMVVLISADGGSAKRLTAFLNEKQGFDNIYYLQGGFEEWIRETNSRNLTYESF